MRNICGLGDISVVLSLMSKMRPYLTPAAYVSDMKGTEKEGVPKDVDSLR